MAAFTRPGVHARVSSEEGLTYPSTERDPVHYRAASALCDTFFAPISRHSLQLTRRSKDPAEHWKWIKALARARAVCNIAFYNICRHYNVPRRWSSLPFLIQLIFFTNSFDAVPAADTKEQKFSCAVKAKRISVCMRCTFQFLYRTLSVPRRDTFRRDIRYSAEYFARDG